MSISIHPSLSEDLLRGAVSWAKEDPHHHQRRGQRDHLCLQGVVPLQRQRFLGEEGGGEVWKLKDQGSPYTITWQILSRARSYNATSRMCRLCLKEKFLIMFAPATKANLSIGEDSEVGQLQTCGPLDRLFVRGCKHVFFCLIMCSQFLGVTKDEGEVSTVNTRQRTFSTAMAAQWPSQMMAY